MIPSEITKLRLCSVSGKGWAQADCDNATVKFVMPGDHVLAYFNPREEAIADIIEEREELRRQVNDLRWQSHNVWKSAQLKSATIDDVRRQLGMALEDGQ